MLKLIVRICYVFIVNSHNTTYKFTEHLSEYPLMHCEYFSGIKRLINAGENLKKNSLGKNGVIGRHMHDWNIHRLKFRSVAGCKDSCRGVFVETQTEGVRLWPLVSKGLFTALTKSLLNKAQVSYPV